MRLYDLEVRWTLRDGVARVTSVAAVSDEYTGAAAACTDDP